VIRVASFFQAFSEFLCMFAYVFAHNRLLNRTLGLKPSLGNNHSMVARE